MISLKPYNTFSVEAFANNLIEINSLSDLITFSATPYFILGSGANTLFTKDFPGTILKNNLSGITPLSNSQVTVASGHDWHAFVTWAVDQNLSGIENMALIPGTVGAAVFGNIAAYGQSVSDVLISVSTHHLPTHTNHTFPVSELGFGYRTSNFKTTLQDHFITSATFQLSSAPKFDTQYHSRSESLLAEMEKVKNERLQRASQAGSHPEHSRGMGVNEKHSKDDQFLIEDVYQAIINIRTKKLPDWTKVGTDGSVFKNPFVTKETYLELKSKIPELQWYPTDGMSYPPDSTDLPNILKIPAGRILDHLGWRGKTVGQVTTHPQNALVVINTGTATGQEIFDYCELMRQSVKEAYGLNLDYEIQIIK
jgi:UDP-N-acetylmuramate dehydrogenase